MTKSQREFAELFLQDRDHLTYYGLLLASAINTLKGADIEIELAVSTKRDMSVRMLIAAAFQAAMIPNVEQPELVHYY